MTTEFKDYINGIADEIITLSLQLNSEIETWHDVVARVPDVTSQGANAGFVSKPNAVSNVELVVDINVPLIEQTAQLRIWAVETIKDSNNNERCNNIQLTYRLDYDKAQKPIEQTDP